MEQIEFVLKDVLYIIGIILSAVISFLSTRYGLKEYIRDKNDLLKEEINQLKLKLQEQKSKDDLQQQVIDQIGAQMAVLVPRLVDELKQKKARK